MLSFGKIRNYYMYGFKEAPEHTEWPWLWSKQLKTETLNGRFVCMNRRRRWLNFKTLKHYCAANPPAHLYMSVLNWLMPDRVGEKRKARYAYPIGGEYVVDIDANTVWRPHSHHIGGEGVCYGCLDLARDATISLLDKISENHSDVHVVFSGRRGFHIHVRDFEVRDWTHYNERNPLRSHEAARFIYTRHLKTACDGFSSSHFILSCDVMRVITFPGSLNGETGLICTYIGGMRELERAPVSEIIWGADATRFLYDLRIVRASELYSHLEPNQREVGR